MYPSLAYINGKSGYTLKDDVFEDVKLTALLKEDTVALMRNVCGKDDILARQEMFRLLGNQDIREHIITLYNKISDIYDLNKRYEKSRCDNEKYILYLNICDRVADYFSESVKKTIKCELGQRYFEYFTKRIAHSGYEKLTTALKDVCPDISGILSYKMKVVADSVRLSKNISESYVEKLLCDAEQLGMSEISEPVMDYKLLDVSIIDAMAKLYPDTFKKLESFYNENKNFYEKEILEYKNELGFYIDIAEMLDRISLCGIPVSYPKISDEKKVDISNAYDITLITKGEKNIIPNDIHFDKDEPFFFLTGANGGGKTTYLRTVGISVILFLCGCPTPCDRAEIYPLHCVFTHFPRDERFDNAGRNAEEVARVNEILKSTDGCSLILLNETFSTTSEEKALSQTTELSEKLYNEGEFGVYVTHQLNMADSKIPYLNVIIDRSDSNRRTYKVAKQKSVYSSYAYDILKKYSLTKEQLAERK